MNKLGFLASEAKMCSGSLTNPSSKFGITRCKKEKTAYFGNEKCLDNKVGIEFKQKLYNIISMVLFKIVGVFRCKHCYSHYSYYKAIQ